METKVCSQCGKELPIEQFNIKKQNIGGHSGQCRECLNEHKRQYGKESKEAIDKQRKKHYLANKEHVDNVQKLYKKNHKTAIYEKRRQNETDNKDALFIRRRELYQINKEIVLARGRGYKDNHKNEMAIYQKQYLIKHPEVGRLNNARRRSRKSKLPSTLTIQQWEEAKANFNNHCAYCGKELPLSQDHFIALTKGGEYSKDNIVPSCQPCNGRKTDRDFFIWYPGYKYYSKKREKAILSYLGYENNIQQLALTFQ